MNFVVKSDTVINFYPTYCVTVVIPHTYNQRSLTRVFVLYADNTMAHDDNVEM